MEGSGERAVRNPLLKRSRALVKLILTETGRAKIKGFKREINALEKWGLLRFLRDPIGSRMCLHGSRADRHTKRRRKCPSTYRTRKLTAG